MSDDSIHASESQAPRRTTGNVLAELWKEILDLAELPVSSDNFFALGGDSMSMVMLESRIKEELGVDVAADVVMNAQTLHELCVMIDVDLKGDGQQSRLDDDGSSSGT